MKIPDRILLSDSNGESGLVLFAFLNLGLLHELEKIRALCLQLLERERSSEAAV